MCSLEVAPTPDRGRLAHEDDAEGPIVDADGRLPLHSFTWLITTLHVVIKECEVDLLRQLMNVRVQMTVYLSKDGSNGLGSVTARDFNR
ncbi:hypothetical protein [Nonomuraea sp. WAC 01424]|uniref:hypothetical protein n=1 Tax=Nonomuraea sp. WAC 01424 TaxID=2203200 RepID=UPI00163BF6F9|nr:hypothetical protein [Nonomuraea sp. WAC 01424]